MRDSFLVAASLSHTIAACGDYIMTFVTEHPDARITYATGNTMIPLYAYIAEAVTQGKVTFSQTQAYHLDEYHPYSPTGTYSFVRYLYEHVFVPFAIPETHIHTLNGEATDPDEEAVRYEKLLGSGVDLCILGIGPGGHIGFNEQGTSFDSRTHLAKLCEETVQRDIQERGQDTPEYALTQGIGNILESKRIILLAHGASKASYIAQAFNQPASVACPASALQSVSEKLMVFLDDEAGNLLKR